MEKELVCISCPLGCRLHVSWTGAGDIRVDGNQCPRGEIYGREEILAPKRVVTATCSVSGKEHRRLPVKTDKPLPRELVDDLLNEVYRLAISLPVKTGDVIMADIAGSGVNLVATDTIH